MSTNLIGGIVFFSFMGIALIYRHFAEKQKAKEAAAFAAEVKAHPGLYYVSQGGTIPDPIVVEDVPVDPAV